MRKSIKKIIAVASSFAMVVAGFSGFQPQVVEAAGTYSTNNNWVNITATGYDNDANNHYQAEGLSGIYAGHWNENQIADVDITPSANDPYTWNVDVTNKVGGGEWLVQIAMNVQNLDSTKAYDITLSVDNTVVYSNIANSATEFKAIASVTDSMTLGQHTVVLAATEQIETDPDPVVQTITITPQTANIAANYNIWANWTNPEGTARAYAYLNQVDNDHAAALKNNAWIFNDQAGQPMTSVDKVGQTRDGSVVVEMGGTYTLIVEAFNAFNKKVGHGELVITIPQPDVIGGDVVFTNSYRQDIEVGGNTYYALYANWEAVPGAAGYKSYVDTATAGNECMASNGWIWSDQNAPAGSTDTHVDTVYSTKGGTLIDANTSYTLVVKAYDTAGNEIGSGTVVLPGKNGGESQSENPSENPSEEPTSGNQGGDADYSDLTWTQVGSTDYYVASIHGTVKNAFPFGEVGMQGDNETIHIVPGVAEGTAPVWPAFTDITLNGVAGVATAEGAGIFVPVSALNANAYNVFEATTAVTNDRFQIIIKAGNPDGPTESVVYTNDLSIEGYQMNSTGITVGEKTYEGGMRTLYQLPATVEGVSTEGAEFGLVYGLKGKVAQNDVTLANEGTYVKKSQATEAGSVGNGLYAMTFATNFTTVTKAHLSRNYYVRVYVIKNGVTYYSPVETFSAFSVADTVYQNRWSVSAAAHDYLFDNILSVLDSTYEAIAY